MLFTASDWFFHLELKFHGRLDSDCSCSSRCVCDLGATDIPYETVDEWRWDFVAR